ncbi:hypothetical protein B5E50_22465 [Bacteroides xylanisolvens]|nr:hypothetical protein B5E50_22465 [Bacteroides xylanisolvens]
MLKQKYFLTGIFILSAERQPIKLSWRKIVWLHFFRLSNSTRTGFSFCYFYYLLHGFSKRMRYENEWKIS